MPRRYMPIALSSRNSRCARSMYDKLSSRIESSGFSLWFISFSPVGSAAKRSRHAVTARSGGHGFAHGLSETLERSQRPEHALVLRIADAAIERDQHAHAAGEGDDVERLLGRGWLRSDRHGRCRRESGGRRLLAAGVMTLLNGFVVVTACHGEPPVVCGLCLSGMALRYDDL